MIQLLIVLIVALLYNTADAKWQRSDDAAKGQNTRVYKVSEDVNPAYVVYDRYGHNSSVVDYAVEYAFLITNNNRREQLESYKPKPVQMPLVSIMVVENVNKVGGKGNVLFEEEKGKHVVYFDFNKYKIEKKQKEALDKIPLKGGETVDIFGYACVIGAKTYNRKLSQKRAEEVANYLHQKHVIIDKVVGEGETSEESTIEKNRKVVVKVKQTK